MLRDNDLGATVIQLGDKRVAVERLVCNQTFKSDAVDQRRYLDAVVALAGHQPKAQEIAECIGESEDFGRHASSGATDGLALSPPFAP